MNPVVNIVNRQKKITVDRPLLLKIRKVIRQALAVSKARPCGKFSVCLVDAKLIRRLNRKYFGKNNSTDVIAFSTGDIAVSTDAAVINAAVFKTAPLYELLLYVVHGTLHILGYDDRTPVQRRIMKNEAEMILKKAGVINAHT